MSFDVLEPVDVTPVSQIAKDKIRVAPPNRRRPASQKPRPAGSQSSSSLGSSRASPKLMRISENEETKSSRTSIKTTSPPLGTRKKSSSSRDEAKSTTSRESVNKSRENVNKSRENVNKSRDNVNKSRESFNKHLSSRESVNKNISHEILNKRRSHSSSEHLRDGSNEVLPERHSSMGSRDKHLARESSFDDKPRHLSQSVHQRSGSSSSLQQDKGLPTSVSTGALHKVRTDSEKKKMNKTKSMEFYNEFETKVGEVRVKSSSKTSLNNSKEKLDQIVKVPSQENIALRLSQENIAKKHLSQGSRNSSLSDLTEETIKSKDYRTFSASSIEAEIENVFKQYPCDNPTPEPTLNSNLGVSSDLRSSDVALDEKSNDNDRSASIEGQTGLRLPKIPSSSSVSEEKPKQTGSKIPMRGASASIKLSKTTPEPETKIPTRGASVNSMDSKPLATSEESKLRKLSLTTPKPYEPSKLKVTQIKPPTVVSKSVSPKEEPAQNEQSRIPQKSTTTSDQKPQLKSATPTYSQHANLKLTTSTGSKPLFTSSKPSDSKFGLTSSKTQDSKPASDSKSTMHSETKSALPTVAAKPIATSESKLPLKMSVSSDSKLPLKSSSSFDNAPAKTSFESSIPKKLSRDNKLRATTSGIPVTSPSSVTKDNDTSPQSPTQDEETSMSMADLRKKFNQSNASSDNNDFRTRSKSLGYRGKTPPAIAAKPKARSRETDEPKSVHIRDTDLGTAMKSVDRESQPRCKSAAAGYMGSSNRTSSDGNRFSPTEPRSPDWLMSPNESDEEIEQVCKHS